METKSINVIITGSTGMVGEGVLHECLTDPRIASITLLSRRSAGIVHAKIKEVLVDDLYRLTGEEAGLSNADACFYCLGVTSVGKNEEEYSRLTYDLTLKIAVSLFKRNPKMTFCYVSAKGTDNSEKGDTMWARVKGKTENDLNKIGFKGFYAFRPFLLTPTRGLRNTHSFYLYISWLFPLGKNIYPEGFCTLKELALAMIYAGCSGYTKTVVTPIVMVTLARL
jgi:hypothetical protein